MKIPIQKNSLLQSEYDDETQTILKVFSGIFDVNKYIEGETQVIKFLESHPTIAILMDADKMKGTFTAANKWIKDNVEPVYNRRIKFLAVGVASQDVFTRFALSSILKLSKAEYEMTIHKDFNTAKIWLEKKMNQKLNWY
jgi:O-succinylbenzoate synthase